MEKRTDIINFRISPDLKEAAKKAAAADGRTISNYIEKLIKDDLKKNPL